MCIFFLEQDLVDIHYGEGLYDVKKYGRNFRNQLAIDLLLVAWTSIIMLSICYSLSRLGLLRVDPTYERIGADMFTEGGYAYPEFLQLSMKRQGQRDSRSVSGLRNRRGTPSGANINGSGSAESPAGEVVLSLKSLNAGKVPYSSQSKGGSHDESLRQFTNTSAPRHVGGHGTSPGKNEVTTPTNQNRCISPLTEETIEVVIDRDEVKEVEHDDKSRSRPGLTINTSGLTPTNSTAVGATAESGGTRSPVSPGMRLVSFRNPHPRKLPDKFKSVTQKQHHS